ncbi:cyclase family protein [Geobacter sp. AOG1]|uniref:cyclase family protein n=1 Tax=Geobacter sp. AOG1 TaxID=1566346 RepID=UPI001CC4B273|nr:cyclase family protein [Geobacter sp. AOG1]GFE56489.1 cyclase [Geobacter sp. AOG1]
MKIYDISTSISADLPTYPGDPPVRIEPVTRISRGDTANVSRLTLTTHSGTHLDVMRHYSEHGMAVDHVPLTLLVGKALVIELAGVREIGRRELARFPVKGEERILLKTDNSLLWEHPGFHEEYAHLTEEGARYLLDAGVRLVGIDYLSIERFDGNGEVHRLLLGNGAVVLEGLNLDGVTAGHYELICLPLKVKDGDGAPVRAILRSHEAVSPSTLEPHTSRWPLS